MRIAAIGIGSNSLRMLLADLSEGKLERIKRYREGLRVFSALDEQKNILPSMIHQACQSVRAFQQEALAQGVKMVHLFATSAVRDAANQLEFAQKLREATGLELDICSGEREAQLSFWGVSEAKPTGLIDIGGGSTELAVGHGREVEDAVSLQAGAVRLYRLAPITTPQEARRMVEYALEILNPVRSRFVRPGVHWVGVGGTFTTSAALAQGIPWQEREKIHGYCLKRQELKELLEHMASLTMQQRLTLPGLQPQRADIVAHGMAILLACMRMLGISQIEVSEYGNLEGYLKAKYLFTE